MYDLPPTAPIPPERYCFEQSKSNGTTIAWVELTVEGDSAFGKVEYDKTENVPGGEFKGVMLGTTLLVNCKLKTDSGITLQDQEWKLERDTLFRIKALQTTDTAKGDNKTAGKADFVAVLHKVRCK